MAKMNFKFGRKKTLFTTEESALQDVLQKTQVEATNLKPAHKDKIWYWEEVTAKSETKDKTFTVEKTPDLKLSDAKKLAMAHFKTFEGNIKIVDQDETHFVFSKVRG